jgi:hypothetical protein
MNPSKSSSVALLTLLIGLSACGGGGEKIALDPSNPINQAPTVFAGTAQTANAMSEVNLNGSAYDSDGSVSSYNWTQTSGDIVSLQNANTANASFTMPSSPSNGTFIFSLTVIDNLGKSASDNTTVTYINNAPTVDAGPDLQVAPSSTVNLNGTATDMDGNISSYSWIQTSGDTVNLSNNETANASFIMPNSLSTSALTFTLTVTDSDGETASDTVAVSLENEPNGSVTISGNVTFDLVPFNISTNGLDYSKTTESAVRGVLVEAMDTSGTRVGATTTDSNGFFSLETDANTTLRIRISAQMVQTEGAQWDVKVTDNTNNDALYITEGDLFNTSQNIIRDFRFTSGWNGTSYTAGNRAAAPFAILDAIYDSMQKVISVDPDVVFPPLEVHWSENNSVAKGNIENGDIGTSFYNEGKIYILGKQDSDTDEYDRHIIVHEWGHYFEDKLSRSESLGGSHGDGERLDMRVAFSEGWGNALSAMVTDDPFYRDSSGDRQSDGWSMDMESNYTINRGWFNETSVQSILYDLYDTDTDGEDNLAFGFEPIYSALTHSNFRDNPYFTSIYPFMKFIKEQYPFSGSAIGQLLSGQKIYGSGNNGVGETNDGRISAVLPIYKTVSLGNGNINVCYINEAGVQNKLGNHIYIAFEAVSTGSYTFSLNSADSYGAFSDPDLRLYKSGAKIAENIQISSSGAASLTTNLSSTGLHILEVSVWEDSPVLGLGNNGTTCFNLQITN